MAFEIVDFNRHYVLTGEPRGLFNVARSDESATSPRYYLYLNDSGSYIIQKIVITVGVGVYTYYAKRAGTGVLDTDWTNRASLTYVEYNKVL